jgi:hypothetical protein
MVIQFMEAVKHGEITISDFKQGHTYYPSPQTTPTIKNRTIQGSVSTNGNSNSNSSSSSNSPLQGSRTLNTTNGNSSNSNNSTFDDNVNFPNSNNSMQDDTNMNKSVTEDYQFIDCQNISRKAIQQSKQFSAEQLHQMGFIKLIDSLLFNTQNSIHQQQPSFRNDSF